MKLRNFIFIPVLSVMTLTAADKASDAEQYKSAYEFVLRENWQQACQALDAFVKHNPRSQYADDALFWHCYSLEQLNQDLESAFSCYEQFTRQYEKSSWADDARQHMVRVADALASEGKPEYADRIRAMQSSDDKEIAIAAIHALRNMEDEKSLTALLQIYDSNSDPEIREKILFSLSEFDDARALEKLKTVARSDPDAKLRKRALFWVSEHADSDETLQFLVSIVKTDKEREVREQAVFALSEAPSEKGVPLLIDIAKTEKDREIRKKAVYWLADHAEDPAVLEFLKTVALTEPDADIAQQATYALSEAPDKKGLPVLLEIARSHRDIAVRKNAIFWLGEHAESDEIMQALKQFALNEADPEIAAQAVFSLSEAPDKKGLVILRDIAKDHPNREVRKKAVYWIGDNARTEDDIAFLMSVVEHDPDPDVRDHAVFAIAEADDAVGLPTLIQIAKTHKDISVRKKAIFWLGESDDPRAREALMEIISTLQDQEKQ
jgi:HEAT repeat protein